MRTMARRWCDANDYTNGQWVRNAAGEHILDRLEDEPGLGHRILIRDAEATAVVDAEAGMRHALGPAHGFAFGDGSMVAVLASGRGWEILAPWGAGPSGQWGDDLSRCSLDGWE